MKGDLRQFRTMSESVLAEVLKRRTRYINPKYMETGTHSHGFYPLFLVSEWESF